MPRRWTVPDLPLDQASASSTSRRSTPAPPARASSPTSAPTSSRSKALKRMDITRNFVMPDNTGKDDYWNKLRLLPPAQRRQALAHPRLQRGPEARRAGASSSCRYARHRRRELHAARDGEVRPRLRVAQEDQAGHHHDLLSGYGQNGPWRDYTAYGMGLEPASGISPLTGYRDGPPLRTGISFTDPYSGIVGAGAVLAALIYRRRTGKGQYIDLSEQEAAIPVIGYALLDYAMNGRDPKRIGNRSHWYAPQGATAASGDRSGRGDDNWLVITVRNDARVGRLLPRRPAPRVGDGPLRRCPRPLRVPRRNRRADHHVDPRAGPDGGDAPLQKAGVIAAAVLNPKQVLLDPHLRERGFFDMSTSPTSAYGRCRASSARSSPRSR